MAPLPSLEIAVQQSSTANLEFKDSSESEIRQASARFSNAQFPSEYYINRYSDDCLSNNIHEPSLRERGIPFSWPPSPEANRYIQKQESPILIHSTVQPSYTVDLQSYTPIHYGLERASSDGQLRLENSTERCYCDECLRDRLPRLSFIERKIPFSSPLLPSGNTQILGISSLDYPSTGKYCLPNHQQQQASKRNEKVPFLLRIHSGHFHICLGLCSQTVLWKTLNGDSTSFSRLTFKLPTHFTLVLWLLALISFVLMSGAYMLKCIFHFETVRMEYCDRVRVNYLFVPWITGMLLRMGLPSDIAPDKVHPIVCCIFMAPIVVMEVKIYGQWFTRGRRSLARIANPSTYLSIIGNFVVARLATRVDWNEVAMFFFTVGLVHYAVIFVTLYQRFSSDITVSRKITPLFFLFVAGPSSASVTWLGISGSFDTVCKMLLFLSLFLYSALIVRLNLFRDTMKSFSVIWWACAYPMTITSVATIKYAAEVRHPIAQSLALVLSSASIAIVFLLAVLTAMDLLLGRNHLFPADRVLIACLHQNEKGSLSKK